MKRQGRPVKRVWCTSMRHSDTSKFFCLIEDNFFTLYTLEIRGDHARFTPGATYPGPGQVLLQGITN